jgi:hypothetical protein
VQSAFEFSLLLHGLILEALMLGLLLLLPLLQLLDLSLEYLILCLLRGQLIPKAKELTLQGGELEGQALALGSEKLVLFVGRNGKAVLFISWVVARFEMHRLQLPKFVQRS